MSPFQLFVGLKKSKKIKTRFLGQKSSRLGFDAKCCAKEGEAGRKPGWGGEGRRGGINGPRPGVGRWV